VAVGGIILLIHPYIIDEILQRYSDTDYPIKKPGFYFSLRREKEARLSYIQLI